MEDLTVGGEEGLLDEDGSDADRYGKYWLYDLLVKIGYNDEEASYSMQITPDELNSLKREFERQDDIEVLD